MEINVLRSIVTVLSFLSFLGICWWAWSRHNRDHFAAAARLPLDDEEHIVAGGSRGDEAGRLS